ncbi:MAG: Lrp/AsnC family transcriptional regulator [Hyphomicrobiaceae bacterium]|nr:Lrp/AsnC family transcriptional regulator [Hyphomicrobiaceae bacterium]
MTDPTRNAADLDRDLVQATQAGLPLLRDPYGAIAAGLGIDRAEVIARLTALLETGAIRRIGLIPNHYALGITANGMAVFDVADDAVSAIGRAVAARREVTHCYRRPRHPPDWPYNLFAMVHGTSRDDVRAIVADIAAAIGPALAGHDILFSTRILKKTGLRLAP